MKLNFKNTHFGSANRGFLTVEEVVEVLSMMGYSDMSIWIVRRYVSQGLIDQPLNGIPNFSERGTKYRAYYNAQVVHEIAEIRDTLSAGYRINSLMSQRVINDNMKKDTIEDTNMMLELINKYVSKISLNIENINILDEEILRLRKEMIELNKISKYDLRLLKDSTFGSNPTKDHKKILKDYLDKKFGKKDQMKT